MANSAEATSAKARGGHLWIEEGDLTLSNSQLISGSLSGPDVDGGAIAAPSFGAVGRYDVSWSNFYDNPVPAYDFVADPAGLVGNINADPAYTSVAGLDSLSWDLHLLAGSPAIDAGDPLTLDLDGSTADLGAYGGPDSAW